MSKTRNVPLAMTDDLLAQVDRATRQLGENRSAVMRMSIRAGLPLVLKHVPRETWDAKARQPESETKAAGNA